MQGTENTITSEMRSHIDVASTPVTYEIGAWDIARFACAIGDDNPVYTDVTAARRSAYSGLIAPPTFLRSLLPVPPVQPFPEPYAHILDAGSNYHFFHPVRPGDSITVVRTLKDLYTKQGRLGEMLFKVHEISYTRQGGELVATQQTTTITFGRPEAGSVGTIAGTV